MLGQILSWSLLGQPGAVEQLSLQQGEVCLQWLKTSETDISALGKK